MITRIFATDRENNTIEYTVTQEEIEEYNYPGIRYMVTKPGIEVWKFFTVDTLKVSDSRMLIYRVLNNYHPELDGKGIVKAMIKALSGKFKIDIISSTNNHKYKIGEGEGRIDVMTKAWQKWAKEFSNVEFLENEDRFVFHHIP